MWSRNCLPFWSIWVHPLFLVGFILLHLYFYVYVFWIVVCPFVLFLLPIVLSVLLPSIYGFWLPLWYLRTLFKCSKVYCLQNNLTETSTAPFIIILQINQVSEIIFDRIIHATILVYNNHLGLSNNRYMQNTCYTSNYNRFISTTKIYQYLNKLWLINEHLI